MNKSFFILLIATLLFSYETNYWSLGVSINKQLKKTITQKEIDLNNLVVESPTYSTNKVKNYQNNIYTLKTNYLIDPEAIHVDSLKEKKHIENTNINDLIINEEYFEAAKLIIHLESKNEILDQFTSLDDFYYWSSFIYYHLGNYNLAHKNINMITNKDNSPDTLFLESLIMLDYGDIEKSNSILKKIIKEFPDNDYANYAKDFLIDE